MSTEFERICQLESEIDVLRVEITKMKIELGYATSQMHSHPDPEILFGSSYEREIDSMINWGGTNGDD